MIPQLRLPLAAAPARGSGDFVQAASNADACARLARWPAWPGGALALAGPQGVGKSHLAAVWAARTAAAPLAPGAPPPPGAPLLAEDAPLHLHDPAFEEALFHALNRAARGEGGLLLTGRAPPAGWACRLPDLRSRLNALPTAAIGEPDDALLRRLLVKFFRERSVRPGDDLLDYLVRRMDRSAEGAAAIVEALDAACRQGARLGRPLARELLHDLPEDEDGDVD